MDMVELYFKHLAYNIMEKYFPLCGEGSKECVLMFKRSTQSLFNFVTKFAEASGGTSSGQWLAAYKHVNYLYCFIRFVIELNI